METGIRHPQLTQSTHGFVALFDILGYKKLLAGNEVKTCLNIFRKSVTEGLGDIHKKFGRSNQVKQVQSHVFSDSVLVTLPLSNGLTAKDKAVFTFFCWDFMCHMLTNGLPIRGAISYGDFYIDSNTPRQIVFAGQPIVDAYEMAKTLEIAGCAIVPTSENRILNDFTRTLFKRYKTPIKSGSFRKLYLLQYDYPKEYFSRERIVECFAAHKKNLDLGANQKLDNTIEFLKQCCVLKLP